MRAVQLATGAEPTDDFVAVHGDLRAVPRLRAGMPERRAVRPADGRHARRRWPAQQRITPRWQRLAFEVLGHHRCCSPGRPCWPSRSALHLVPKRARARRARRCAGAGPMRPTGDDVWLFTGCVMDAWLRDTHRSTAKVLDAVGITYRLPDAGAACCGALHVHAGLHADAAALAERVMASMPGDAPIVVDSAGCGAAMKDYGHLLGHTGGAGLQRPGEGRPRVRRPARRPAAARAPPGPRDRPGPVPPAPRAARPRRRCAPCSAPSPRWSSSTTRGCAAAPAAPTRRWSRSWPAQIRERKLAAIERPAAAMVASANPGCAMHLAAAGVTVRHPMDLVARGARVMSERATTSRSGSSRSLRGAAPSWPCSTRSRASRSTPTADELPSDERRPPPRPAGRSEKRLTSPPAWRGRPPLRSTARRRRRRSRARDHSA